MGLLLDKGIDVNRPYGNDLTALMWAAGYSNDAPPGEALKTVGLLLRRGAMTNLRDNRGWTALMIAAHMGHAEMIAPLIEAGAGIDIKNKQGKTARDLARAQAKENVLKALDKAGRE